MQSKQPVKGPSRCNVLRNSEGSRRQARGDFSEYSAYNIRASASLRHAPVTLLWLAPECGGRSVSYEGNSGNGRPLCAGALIGSRRGCLNFHRLRPETLGMPVCQAARASEWCATSGRAATTFLRPFRGQRDALESASGHKPPITLKVADFRFAFVSRHPAAPRQRKRWASCGPKATSLAREMQPC